MPNFELLTLAEETGFDPVTYQYFHQLLEKRTIVFNQEVSDNLIETVYLPLKDFEEDDSNAPVTLILNSIGGSVTEGYFLAHYLATYKKRLNIIVTGCAASIATVILAAGGKNPNIMRYGYPCTYALIHDGYVAISSSEAKTAEDIILFNKTVDDSVKDFIIQNTNITEEQYQSKARQQWFIPAKEMLELNLLDQIVGSD